MTWIRRYNTPASTIVRTDTPQSRLALTNSSVLRECVRVLSAQVQVVAMSRWCLVVAVVACVVLACSAEEQARRPKVSDAQLDAALNDKRYLTRQLKCALGEAPCDPVGRRLKTLAPLVLRGACPQCNPEETRQIQRTLSHIQRHYPREWSKIVKQYAGA